MIAPGKPLNELLEKDLELQVIGTKAKPGLARMLGWRAYHTLRSKGSEPGYPDWTLVRDRVVFLELKREPPHGVVTAAQRDWIGALLDAGAEVYVIRPRHLDHLARVLACHGDPYARRDVAEIAARLRQQTRQEAEGVRAAA